MRLAIQTSLSRNARRAKNPAVTRASRQAESAVILSRFSVIKRVSRFRKQDA